MLTDWRDARAEVTAPDPAIVAAERARIEGGWGSYIGYQQQLWGFVQFIGPAIYFENIVEAFGTMLIGMALFKTGIIQGSASRRFYWLFLLAGYGTGLALRIPATIAALRFDALPDIGMVTASLARLPMALGHIGAVSLALGTPLGRRLLRPFEATGKMPLSVYFSASIAAIILFGPPLGLWGRFGFGPLLAIAVAIIAVQLVVANAWARHFETGPFEWLWKSLSYARRQPFRRIAAAASGS